MCILENCKEKASTSDGYCRKHRGRSPKVKEFQAQYRGTHAEKLRAYDLERGSGEKRKTDKLTSGLKSRYNITLEQYVEMSKLGCWLCGGSFGEDDTPCVDHDHKCCAGGRSCGGCVRGLAHGSCNTAIGLLGESPDLMERIASNLRKRV